MRKDNTGGVTDILGHREALRVERNGSITINTPGGGGYGKVE